MGHTGSYDFGDHLRFNFGATVVELGIPPSCGECQYNLTEVIFFYMDRQRQLEELFNKWQNKPNHDETFIKDGIVNLSKWTNQKPKVLFFLKEAYTEEPTDYDLAAVLNKAGADFGRSQIWWRVATWTQAIYCKEKY